MPTPYIGEIRLFAGTYAPAQWALCDGRALQIAKFPSLFELIGTTYGGDGTTTFGLPNVAPLESADGSPVSVCISYYGEPPAGG